MFAAFYRFTLMPDKISHSMRIEYLVPLIGVMLMLTLNSCVADDHHLLRLKFTRSCLDTATEMDAQVSCRAAFFYFITGFGWKESSEMTTPPRLGHYREYYNYYFEETWFPKEPVENNSLFWTNTKNVIPALIQAGANIKPLQSIVSVGIVEKMRKIKNVHRWCSNVAGSVFMNANCKTFQAVYVFWAEASKRLAKQVKGISFYLTSDAYFGDISMYNEFVLGTLLSLESLCTEIVVINVTPEGSTTTCGSGRLLRLEDKVKGKLRYQCFDVFGYTYQSAPLVPCIKGIVDSISRGKYIHRTTNHGTKSKTSY